MTTGWINKHEHHRHAAPEMTKGHIYLHVPLKFLSCFLQQIGLNIEYRIMLIQHQR